MKLIGWLLALGQAVAQGTHLNVFAFNPFGFPQEAISARRMVTVKELYDGPVVILVPNFREQGNSESLHAFIAPQGFSSLSSNLNFQPFYKYLLQHRELSGLAFFPGSVRNYAFLQSEIQDITLPDKHNAADFLHLIENPHNPAVYIAPKEFFNQYHFPDLNQLATMSVTNEQIVVSEVSDPLYRPLHQAADDPPIASPEKLISVLTRSLNHAEEAEDRDVSEHLPETEERE